MMRIRRAFTLIELLTVMAISAILLGLIIVPLFQSFNLTRAAQAFAEGQDRARILSERIAREIGNAYSVRGGNGLQPVVLNGVGDKVTPSTLVITVPTISNGLKEVPLPDTKLDLILPAEGDQTEIANGVFTNPANGTIDPTLGAPKGQVVLPAAPGFAIVRYFIARRNPFQDYNNPYDGLLMQRGGGRDNLYVLYRAQIQPYIRRAGTGANGDTSIAWRPDKRYFESDDQTDSKIVYTLPHGTTANEIVSMDDPRFMEPDRDGSNNIIANNAQATRINNWLKKAVIQTEVSRYDMILPVYNRVSRRVEMVNGLPRIVPLIQFRPERMNNDPATGHVAVRQGEESFASEAAGPDVFTTQYALWSSAVIRTYPRGWDTDSSRNEYLVGLVSERSGDAGYAPGFSIYSYDPEDDPDDFNIENLKRNELFDVNTYVRLGSQKGAIAGDRIYPFTAATAAANTRAIANGGPGLMANARLRELFTPYSFDGSRGQIVASFGIGEVGDSTKTPPVSDPNNLPVYPTSLAGPYTPATAPDKTGNFYDAKYRSINDLFNKVYNDFPQLLPNRVHRFIDLRVVPNADGTPSPLFPNAGTGFFTGFTYLAKDASRRNRVQIVPGSEVIYGPDQLPGPHYGQPIRYSRITTGEPGPNQYKINYADMQEPLDSDNLVSGDGYVNAYDLPTSVIGSFDPGVYDPTNFISAVLQPRYKVGYIQLNSDPNIPIPFNSAANNSTQDGLLEQAFRISYRFQFTGTLTAEPDAGGRTKTDSFAVDYDSRQLIGVLLTIRNYPQSSVPDPQTVTLKSTAKVRNYTR